MAAIFDQITAALVRGARVELRGFGIFTVKQRNVLICATRRRCSPLTARVSLAFCAHPHTDSHMYSAAKPRRDASTCRSSKVTVPAIGCVSG